MMTFDDVSGRGCQLLCCCLHERFEVGLGQMSRWLNIKCESRTDFKSHEDHSVNGVHKFLNQWSQSRNLFNKNVDRLHHWIRSMSNGNIRLLLKETHSCRELSRSSRCWHKARWRSLLWDVLEEVRSSDRHPRPCSHLRRLEFC